MAESVRLAAAAKLNLYLHVTGKRADGYHLLDALIAFVDAHDTLKLTRSEHLSFRVSGPFAEGLGDSESNLVVRAARALADAAGKKPHVDLHLVKRLPVASGIGGGSADAAACLKGLAQLWGLDPATSAVRAVAASLGADIPCCVDGRAGFMGGIGTEMSPAPRLPPTWVVLANPGIALSTAEVYRGRTGGFSRAARFSEAPEDAAALAVLLTARHNDLTTPALARVPEIHQVLGALEGSAGCLLARMSGSGATCFGLYADAAGATRAAKTIGAANPDWWVVAGKLLEDTASLKGG